VLEAIFGKPKDEDGEDGANLVSAKNSQATLAVMASLKARAASAFTKQP
jgi:hypothetical protein